jgi:hypothetical protein
LCNAEVPRRRPDRYHLHLAAVGGRRARECVSSSSVSAVFRPRL